MNNSRASTEVQISFSVIIPAYNAETTILRALNSVSAQSYPAHEIIIVDDASTDHTLDIVDADNSGKFKLITKQTNTGSSDTRNIGMNVATGNYIAFLDADDIWHRDKLRLISEALSSNPDICLFFHPYTQDNIKTIAVPQKLGVNKFPFVKLLPSNKIATSCAIIKNDASFRFKTSMRYTEDFDLWLKIGYKHGIYFSPNPLTQIFRPFLSEGGISANKWKMRQGEMRAYTGLAKLNALFILALPFLYLLSLSKHVFKAITGK